MSLAVDVEGEGWSADLAVDVEGEGRGAFFQLKLRVKSLTGRPSFGR